MLGFALFMRGRWGESVESLQTAADTTWETFVDWPWGVLLWVKAHAGHDDFLTLWHEHQDRVPQPGEFMLAGRIGFAATAAVGLAQGGARSEAAALRPLVVGLIPEAATLGPGFLTTGVAAVCAAAGQEWEVAEQEFETALRQAHDMPDKISQPEVRRFYARMLIDRDGPGDRERATRLLDEALDMYRTLGMPKHLELAEGLVKQT